MKDGFHAIDSDLHVIETEEVYEKFLDDKYRDKMPRYLGWSPTNFPHWDVQGQTIPPWARAPEVVGPQQSLDAPTEHLYRPIRERSYDALSTLQAMDAEGIDIAVVYRTFAHMVVSIDDLQPEYATPIARLLTIGSPTTAVLITDASSRRRSCLCMIPSEPPQRLDVPSSRRGMWRWCCSRCR